jgi:hypothetical protein
MIATMKTDPIPHCGTYNQDDPSSVATLRRVDATGFIGLNVLSLKVATKRRNRIKICCEQPQDTRSF